MNDDENNFRPDRLLKLADHLESGKLGHKTFHFGSFNGGYRSDPPVPNCGTRGCAIGECPIVFPEDWIFDSDFGVPMLLRTGHETFVAAEIYFGLGQYESEALFGFGPSWAPANPWNPAVLLINAAAAEVAASIRRFVTWKLAQFKVARETAGAA